MNRIARIAAGLAMSIVLTGCVGYVRDSPDRVVYLSSGYYYGSYYDEGYYHYHHRDGRRYYERSRSSPSPTPAPTGSPAPAPVIIVAPAARVGAAPAREPVKIKGVIGN